MQVVRQKYQNVLQKKKLHKVGDTEEGMDGQDFTKELWEKVKMWVKGSSIYGERSLRRPYIIIRNIAVIAFSREK